MTFAAATEIVDLEGIPGQTTANPRPSFNNHQLVEYDGKLYDPSYGSVASDFDFYIVSAVHSVVRQSRINFPESLLDFDLDGDGALSLATIDVVVWKARSAIPTAIDFQWRYIGY